MRRFGGLIRTTSLILTLSLLLSGCTQEREVPVLEEPVTERELFRPVTRMDVGELKVSIGNVTPMPYCHYFERQTIIDEINCTVGQYVNKGDVLVTADTESMKEELVEMQASLKLLVDEHAAKEPLHDLNIKILSSKRQECLYRYDEEGASQYTTEIKKTEEDHTYDEELYAYMVDYYQSEIAKLEKSINEKTIKAKVSGYVTYIKDTSKGSTAKNEEAIVIVSDFDDLYIEVPDITTATNTYGKYEVKYAIIKGNEVPIEEMEYSSKEQVYAKSQGNYPCVRYKTLTPQDLKIGETVILCFVRRDRQDVLTVGYDSSNSDENGIYVYVKKDDGSLEKRYIEIGITDDYYYEVLSGLEEGEEVLYTQESVAPVSYEEYTVVTGTQRTSVLGSNLKKAEIVNTAYFTPCDGKIESLNADPGQEVHKGDVLAVIDSGSGEAAIKEIENEIKHLNMDYEKYVKDADKNIKTMTVQGLQLLTVIEQGKEYGTLGEHDEDAINCQKDVFDHQVSIAKIEKEVRRIEYEDSLARLNRQISKIKKNNNGSGKISVIAKEDGVVSSLYVKEGDIVKYGGDKYLLLSCTRSVEGIGSLSVGKGSEIPPLGCSIEISINESDDKYTGKAISCIVGGKAYAFTEDDKIRLSVCESSGVSNTKSVLFELDDKEFFDKVKIKDCEPKIQVLYAEDLVIVPGSVVYKEENVITSKMRYFVWKIMDGKPVKQYVVKGSTYGIGDEASVVILRGLEPGDVLAKESSAAKAAGNEEQ